MADPLEPVFLDTFEVAAGLGRIGTGNGRLYVANDDDGLLILDLVDPAAPAFLSNLSVGEPVLDLIVDGDVAYISTGIFGVYLYDISEPTPSLLSDVELMGAEHLAIGDTLLYVSRGEAGIQVIDVGNSLGPIVTGDSLTSGETAIGDIALVDTFLVATRGGSELLLFRAERLGDGPLAVMTPDSTVGRIGPAGEAVLVTTEHQGLLFMDIVIPESATYISNLTFSFHLVADVALAGDTACLAAGVEGVHLAGVEDELEIYSIGNIPTTGNAVACETADRTLFTAETGRGLAAYDLSTLSEVGSIDLPGSSQDLLLNGEAAYVCAGVNGLYVVDVSDREDLSLVDSLDNGGVGDRFTRDLSLSGNRLAVAEGEGGVRIVDVTDPLAPVALGSYDPGDYVVDVAFSTEDVLYLSLRSTGLMVLDISDPAQPDSVGILEMDILFLLNLEVLGNVVYLTETLGYGMQGQIHIVSIADPFHPVLAQTLDSGGSPSNVRVVGERAYVAASFGGLEIYGSFDDYGFLKVGVHEPYGRLVAVGSANNLILAADDNGLVWPFLLGEGEVLTRGKAVDLGGEIADVVVGNEKAFVSFVGENRIDELEIPDPDRIEYLRSIELTDEAPGMMLADSLLYVANASAGLRIYDISAAGESPLIGSFVTGDGAETNLGAAGANRVVVESTTAYVVTDSAGLSLFILDVTDPAVPAYLGGVSTIRKAVDVAVSSGFVYIPVRASSGYVIDATDPVHPVRLPDEGGLVAARRLDVVAEAIFAARRDHGLTILDINDPGDPEVFREEATPGLVNDLTVFGTYIALSDANALRLYRQKFANADQNAPVFTIGILPNTFVNAFVDFVVVISEPLLEIPEVRFTMGQIDSILPVYRIDAPRNVYHGTFRLDTTGIGSVRVSGEDLAGNKSETSKGFSVTYVRGSKGGSVYNETGKMEVRIPPGAVGKDSYVLLTTVESWEIGGAGAPSPACSPYRLSMGSLDRPATLLLRDPPLDDEGNAPALFRKSGDLWDPVATAYDAEAGTIEAELPGSSVFLFSHEKAAVVPPVPVAVLEPNRPNPFNPQTILLFRVSVETRVRLAVYDIRGRLVREIADRVFPAGASSVVWDGRNEGGRPVASGVYLTRFEAAGQVHTRKMLLIR